MRTSLKEICETLKKQKSKINLLNGQEKILSASVSQTLRSMSQAYIKDSQRKQRQKDLL